MTSEEEDIVKHHVNCGRLKNRLALFLHGMKSIEKKVHPVNSINTFVCMYIRTCSVSSSVTPHVEKYVFAFRELAIY